VPREPVTPIRMRAHTDAGSSNRALLVAATVFIVLFGLGVMSSGDTVAAVAHRLGQLTAWNKAAPTPLSDLENRAVAGDSDAQIRLGLQLVNTAKPDYSGAARWFEVAAKSGSLEAQYDLGVLTGDGLGVKRDPVGAAILFMNAAAGGFPAAEYRIGHAYQNGVGVPRSSSFAAMWYERAARHGVRPAQSALAALYATGDGVQVDPVQAFAWYRLAEEEGDRDATAKRVELYRNMSVSQRQAAVSQAKLLIGDVGGTTALAPSSAHPTVDRLIARAG
jgi:TPR repeat protein